MFLDSTEPDCRLCIFFKFRTTLLLLGLCYLIFYHNLVLHFININSPDSLFCLIVFVYHRLFCFLFLSCPTEMSSSAIKSKNFSKAALQPDSIFTTDLCFLLSVLSPSLFNGSQALIHLLPWSWGLKIYLPTFLAVFFHLCTDVEVPDCFTRCHLNSERVVPRQPVTLLPAFFFLFLFFPWFKASFMLFFTFSTIFLDVFNTISKMW